VADAATSVRISFGLSLLLTFSDSLLLLVLLVLLVLLISVACGSKLVLLRLFTSHFYFICTSWEP